MYFCHISIVITFTYLLSVLFIRWLLLNKIVQLLFYELCILIVIITDYFLHLRYQPHRAYYALPTPEFSAPDDSCEPSHCRGTK